MERSWLGLCGMGLLFLIQPVACDKQDAAQSASELPVVESLLWDVSEAVLLPVLESNLKLQEELLVTLEALQSDPQSESMWEEARAGWIRSMAGWQQLEVMQIGPAASSLSAIAGEDRRDEIYSWPTINPCRVDQETALEGWTASSYFDDNLVNAYGFDAMEHLLFAELSSVCPSQVDPVADGSWSALGDEGVRQHRAAFALALLEEIHAQTDELQALWSPDGGDFGAEFALDSDDSPYATQEESLAAVFNALFYVETVTKDLKLARPLGLSDCSEEICPEDLEGGLSQSSLASIEANLRGFELLFTGGEGVGFDDLLEELGHADIRDEILSGIDQALAQCEALSMPLDQALTLQKEEVQALYDALRLITTPLKEDLATVLALEIPSEAAGDND